MMRVKNKHGAVSIGMGVFFACVGLLFIGTGVDAYLNSGQRGTPPIWAIATFLIAAMIGFITAASVLTKRVEIDKQSIKDLSLLGKFETKAKSILGVEIMPVYGNTFLFGWNVVIRSQGSYGSEKRHVLWASLYSNRHELVKALLEVAYFANPKVSIDPLLMMSYGKPPYGLLYAKQGEGRIEIY